MRLRINVVLPAAALLCLTACDFEDMDGGFGRFTRDIHLSYPLTATGRLAVETFNGSIEISGWDQDTVDISGTKYGPTQAEADALNVNIDHAADSVSIRVARPVDRRGNRGARFIIKVPRRAIFDRLVSSNGAIRTTDGAGPARIHTRTARFRCTASKATWTPRLPTERSSFGISMGRWWGALPMGGSAWSASKGGCN